MLNTSIVRFSPYGSDVPLAGFIKLFLGSGCFLQQASRSITGSAQVNMGPSHLKRMAFPVPPLAEQRRIVAKVEELISTCDQLERSLVAGEKARAQLLEALLHDALAEGAGTRSTL
jgi:type I restriction enzyme, S subunit